MTFEATLRYNESAAGQVIQNYNFSQAMALEKGSLVKYSGSREVAITAGAADVLAGIVGRESLAGDGRPNVPVHKKGYFDMHCSGAIVLGGPVVSSATANMVSAATIGTASSHSGSQILGYAEETGTGETNTEKIIIRVDL